MSADAFLRAIRAAPDDDLPRLVFADYLDETGDPARAEFIRVQCELATLPDHDPRRRALEDREHDLLSEHELQWLGALYPPAGWAARLHLERTAGVPNPHPRYLREWEWRRGFVDEVAISSVDMEFLEDTVALGTHPITGCRINVSAEEVEPVYVSEFFSQHDGYDRPWLSRLRRIDLSSCNDGLGLVAGLIDHPRLVGVREWDLRNLRGINDFPSYFRRHSPARTVRALSFGGRSGPNFQQYGHAEAAFDAHGLSNHLSHAALERLSVPDAGLTSDGLRTLLAAPYTATLTHLDISENPIAPDAYRVFEQARRSLRLERLDVSGTPLAGISLEPLLHARSLEWLTRLEMNGCGSARRNMEVLAGSPFWAQADHLRAHSGTIPASTFEPLAHSHGPPALRLLDLADNYLRTAGVRLLCEAPWAGSLTWLALSANYLDDESCRVLARSGRFTHLRTLHLAHNNVRLDRGEGEQITDAGAAELATEPSLANLRLLSLSNTGVTHRGVNAVLNGLYWRLFGLGLAGNDLSPEVVRILAGSPRLARFVWLDLADNPRLRGHALMPLAESPYLSRLCELDCGGIDLADDVRAAFRERLGPRFSH